MQKWSPTPWTGSGGGVFRNLFGTAKVDENAAVNSDAGQLKRGNDNATDHAFHFGCLGVRFRRRSTVLGRLVVKNGLSRSRCNSASSHD